MKRIVSWFKHHYMNFSTPNWSLVIDDIEDEDELPLELVYDTLDMALISACPVI